HAGHDAALAIFVKLKEGLMLPDVGAVVRDEHRDVTEQLHARARRVLAELVPVARETVLNEAVIRDFLAVQAARFGERGRLAPHERRVPLRPGAAARRAFERAKERVVFEPVALRATKCLQPLLLVERGAARKALEGFAQTAFAQSRGRGVEGALGESQPA